MICIYCNKEILNENEYMVLDEAEENEQGEIIGQDLLAHTECYYQDIEEREREKEREEA